MNLSPDENESAATAARPSIVRVAYRPFHHPAPQWNPADLGRGYAYIWTLDTPAAVGDRVVVDHYGGSKAVVVGFGTSYPEGLNRVYRRATTRELQTAREKFIANEARWVELVRTVAGLSPARSRRHAIPGFPKVAAASPGRCTEQEAGEALQMWRRALTHAQDRGWPDGECQRIEQIIDGWTLPKAAGRYY